MADKISLGHHVRWLRHASPTLWLLVACETPSAPPIMARAANASAHAVPRASHASAPFDMQALIERAHFAYRAEGPDFEGGHATYAVRATARGALRFRPRLPKEQTQSWRRHAVEGSPLSLETVAILRGATTLASGPAHAIHTGEDGRLALQRGTVTEELVNTEDGVEQSWRFAERPAGSGDLVVQVRVAGQTFTTETDKGLHFVDRKTGLGVRYGVATWVDGQGTKRTLRPRYQGGSVELAVPAELLEASVYPAVLDPLITPEYGTDAVVSSASNQAGTYRSCVVFGGGTYLAVWEDYRGTTGSNSHIFAARVGPDGAVADPLGIQIGFGPKGEADPKAAFDGQNFLVVWQDWRGWDDDIYAQLLSPAGTLVGSNFPITTATQSQTSPSIAYSGSGYMVAWTDHRNSTTSGSDIYGAYVTVGGAVTETAGSLNSTTAGWQAGPVVACDGSTRCLIAWSHPPAAPNYDVYGKIVSSKGVTLVPEMAIASGSHAELNPAAVWEPVSLQFLVVWDDDRNNGALLNTGRDLYARTIGPAGEGGREFVITGASGHQSSARLGADGANGTLIAWADSRSNPSQIMAIRLRPDGTFADQAEFATTSTPTGGQVPDVATSGREYVVGWREWAQGGGANRYLTRVALTPAGGTVLDAKPILASKGANRQRMPGVAFDGTNYLLVWEDRRDDAGGDIFGALVDPSGNVLASAATGMVFPRLAATPETNPVVAFDGTNFLVVWQRQKTSGKYDNDLYSARVTKSGTVLDTTALKVAGTANDETDANIAFDGTSYLVVWQDHNTTFIDDIAYGVSGALVAKSTGAVTGTVSIVAPGLSRSKMPAVAWGSSSYLVVYDYNWNEIRGALVTRSGTVTDVATPLAMGGNGSRRMPGVASNGSDFLFAYVNATGSVAEVTSAAVRADGTVFSAETNLSPGKTILTAPEVVWDGWNYLVGWSDASDNTNYDLVGAWVNSMGARVGGGFVSSEGTSEAAPALAAEGTGRVLVAYHRYDSDPAFQAERIRFRFASLGGTLGVGCVRGEECSSGQCVDGVCCNTSCAGGTGDCQACSVAAGAAKDGICAATTGNSCSDGNACTRTDTCQAGTCTGTNSVVCTPGLCHSAATCNLASGACTYVNSQNGTACSDGNACTKTDSCQEGACTGANPVVCSAQDQCHDVGTCDPASGACSNPARANGATCSDGNACTKTDTCQAGACAGTNPVVCSAQDQCHNAGTCDRASGTCSNPTKTNGTPCNDGNTCTQADTCQTGTCTGANPVVCAASDQCHNAGTCDPGTGTCSNPAKNNGAACSDGDACTQTDTCQEGSCTGASPVVCTASDQCHVAGTCDSRTGVCSNPSKSNGSSCSDGNACTQTDTCQDGACGGTNPVACSASDACHLAGVCNPSTGQCSHPAKPDNTGCDDGNLCTQSDTCQSGNCTGGNPMVCAASDPCHQAGACDPSTGQCSNPSQADGFACTDGNACTQADTCQAGKCTGKDPIACTAADVCHEAGTCNPQTGVCTSPAKSNGTACGTGSGCTQTDTCQAGVCTTGPSITCPAPDSCHGAGTCDTSAGKCMYPEKANGTSCSDGNACTQTDTCQAGSCVGGDPVACFASDQCHDVGECDPQTGACQDPPKPNTSACNDGNACTRTDTCQGGVCVGFNPVLCFARDQCHTAGACQPTTGKCSSPAKIDGSACSDDNACTLSDSCQAGACTGADPVRCSAADQCHDVGLCDTLTGACSDPPKQESTTCDDGNLCTSGDFCQEGECWAGMPLLCAAPSECQGDGVCDAVKGCVYPSANEGGACDDGDACTVEDACREGVCTGEGEPCTPDAGSSDAAFGGGDAAVDAGTDVDARQAADSAVQDGAASDSVTDMDPLVEDRALTSFYACQVGVGERPGALALGPLLFLLALGIWVRARRIR